MRISVHENYWSKTINLESVGINTQAHTYAPTNSVGRASRMDMDVMMEDVMKFENQFPIEPGAQVPGRKRTSSRMYALPLILFVLCLACMPSLSHCPLYVHSVFRSFAESNRLLCICSIICSLTLQSMHSALSWLVWVPNAFK